jgi:hypothetical protein
LSRKIEHDVPPKETEAHKSLGLLSRQAQRRQQNAHDDKSNRTMHSRVITPKIKVDVTKPVVEYTSSDPSEKLDAIIDFDDSHHV